MPAQIDLAFFVQCPSAEALAAVAPRIDAVIAAGLAASGVGAEAVGKDAVSVRFAARDVGSTTYTLWQTLLAELLEQAEVTTLFSSVFDDDSFSYAIQAKQGQSRYALVCTEEDALFADLDAADDKPALIGQLIDAGKLPSDQTPLADVPEDLGAAALVQALDAFRPGQFLPFLLLAYADRVEKVRFFEQPDQIDNWVMADTTRRLVADRQAQLQGYALVYDAYVNVDDREQDALMVVHDMKGTAQRQYRYRRYDPRSGAVLDAVPQSYKESASLFTE